jgi:lysophospholipase L1-like esterase
MLVLLFYALTLFSVALLFYQAWRFKGRRRGRVCFWFGYSLAVFVLLEAALLRMFFAKERSLLFLRPLNPNRKVFQSHPHLVAQGIPNVSATVLGTTISHNALGFRGPEVPLDAQGKKRIVAIGGSTTYGVYVSDAETWPALLQRELGERVEVINAGIPAASTVEHIHLLATIIPELKPDVILLHVGLNDVRSMHVRGLAPDYANFHPPSIIGNIGLCPEETLPRVATIRALVIVLQRAGLYPECSFAKRAKGTLNNAAIDLYAAGLFERNVRTLLLLAQALGARVVLIPQILVEDMIKDGSYRWWTPYIDQRFLITALSHYNRILADQAAVSGQLYASTVLDMNWQKEHFADSSHLNQVGNQEFARWLAQLLKEKGIVGG